MANNFLMGREYLKRKKLREKKKLISVALGFPDLIFAAGGIPVFPIRLESFKMNTFLTALNSATNVLGWGLTSKFLDFARQFDVLKIVDKILEEVINSTNQKYNQMYERGLQNGVPLNLCYGIYALYGMHKEKKQIDANLNFAMRCREWNQISESLKLIVPNQIWVDIPPNNLKDENERLSLMMTNVNKAIDELEEITGNVVSDNSLNKQFRIGNQVKRFYNTILYEIGSSDFYPCNPATFAEILALLTISFQDYNSNAQRFLENMSHLVKEMRERVKKGIGTDVSNMPKLLFSPMYSGWEPEIHEIIYKLGGRILYADWEVFGLLEEITVSKDNDPIESYSRFLLNASTMGIGCDRENLVKSYLNAAENLKVDGLIFNQVYGCPSLANIYDYLKQKIESELNLPVTLIKFKKIGENIEEIENRLRPFMEDLRKNED
jgi:benzoyl-CoA reductase/2-hydroxyglutaryl-CoA dehydratase subunit BcrC/BadD/HgdB